MSIPNSAASAVHASSEALAASAPEASAASAPEASAAAVPDACAAPLSIPNSAASAVHASSEASAASAPEASAAAVPDACAAPLSIPNSTASAVHASFEALAASAPEASAAAVPDDCAAPLSIPNSAASAVHASSETSAASPQQADLASLPPLPGVEDSLNTRLGKRKARSDAVIAARDRRHIPASVVRPDFTASHMATIKSARDVLVECGAGGDCFFHCVLWQAQIFVPSLNLPQPHQDLRTAVAGLLRTQWASISIVPEVGIITLMRARTSNADRADEDIVKSF